MDYQEAIRKGTEFKPENPDYARKEPVTPCVFLSCKHFKQYYIDSEEKRRAVDMQLPKSCQYCKHFKPFDMYE